MSKERLVELIKRDNCQYPCLCSSKCKYVNEDDCHSERLADLILADGWIRLPCKVGDVVYRIANDGKTITEERVGAVHLEFTIDNGTGWQDVWWLKDYNIGNTAFLSREEAEAKLKEGKNNA